jgi:hypothetical protein
MQNIASLPRLKNLKMGMDCVMAEGAMFGLSRCRSLIHLEIDWQDGLNDVLRVIGRKLSNLVLIRARGVREREERESIKQTLKNGLKILAKLKINGESVRLGTDWKGI